MVRQRKHDGHGKKTHTSHSQSGRPAKQDSRPPPKDPHKLAADSNDQPDNMQYVSNSRSKARLLQLEPSPGFFRWLLRLRLTKLFLILILTVIAGFICGRMVHGGFLSGRESTGIQKDLRGSPNGYGSNGLRVNQQQLTAGREANLKQQAAQHVHGMAHRQPDAPLQQPAVHPAVQQPAKHGAQPPLPLNPEERRAQEMYDKHMAQRAANIKSAQGQQAQQHAAQHPAIQPPGPAIKQPVIPNQSFIQRPGQQSANGLLHAQLKQAPIQDAPSDVETYPYHVIQTLTNTHKMPHLKARFIECTKSILEKASINLHFFFVVDEQSRQFVMDTLQDITNQRIAKNKFQFHFIAVNELAHQLAPLVSMLQKRVSSGNPYYEDAIFFLSIAIHRGILPSYVRRIVMLDTDLKFMADIKGLFDRFDLFTSGNIMGIAREMQPVYRHLLSLYRSQNRGTKVGDPPPDGLTGFNSGVVLLDLEKMRASATYRGFVDADKIQELSNKYHFKGHLGDQDFFTLISLERPDLFHILPCSWNRQLCVWWRDKGYLDVFDQYFKCDEKINVYHGNCNTPIPY